MASWSSIIAHLEGYRVGVASHEEGRLSRGRLLRLHRLRCPFLSMQRREVFHQQAMHEDVATDDFAEENTFGAVAARFGERLLEAVDIGVRTRVVRRGNIDKKGRTPQAGDAEVAGAAPIKEQFSWWDTGHPLGVGTRTRQTSRCDAEQFPSL